MSANTFKHYSGLGSLLRNRLVQSDTFDEENRRIYPLTRAELGKLEDDATSSVASLACGLATIGKLLIHVNADELTANDVQGIGDLIATMGEAINELASLAQSAAGGFPGRPDSAAEDAT